MMKDAIILAGGFGTRLQQLVKDIPKPMAPVNGRPFLDYQLEYLGNEGIQKVILSVGYLWEQIHEHYGNKYKKIDIDYSVENSPLGTGGGIKKAMTKISTDEVFIINGDTLFMVNLLKFRHFHQSKFSKISIVLRELDNIERFGSVVISGDNRIIDFKEKNENKGKGLINGGIYLINKDFFLEQEFPEKFSIEKDCFEKLYEVHEIYGKVCRQYFLDIGIPEDYKKAQHEFKRFPNF